MFSFKLKVVKFLPNIVNYLNFVIFVASVPKNLTFPFQCALWEQNNTFAIKTV